MLRLLCAKNQSFFQRLASQIKNYQNIDLPTSHGTARLNLDATDESLEASVITKDGKDILKFEAYYIEEDEYGDPAYDIYINGEAEENQSESDVEYAFGDWATALRNEVGIYGEEAEERLMESGGLSGLDKLWAYYDMYKDTDLIGQIPRQPLIYLTQNFVVPYIQNYLKEHIYAPLFKGFSFEIDDGSMGKDVFLNTSYSVFGIKLNFRMSILVKMLKYLFMYNHDPEKSIDKVAAQYLTNLGVILANELSMQLPDLFDFWDVDPNAIHEGGATDLMRTGLVRIRIDSFMEDATQEMYRAQDFVDYDEEDSDMPDLPPEALTDVETFLNLPSPMGTIKDELDAYVADDLKIKDVTCYCDNSYGVPRGWGWMDVYLTA